MAKTLKENYDQYIMNKFIHWLLSIIIEQCQTKNLFRELQQFFKLPNRESPLVLQFLSIDNFSFRQLLLSDRFGNLEF